MNTATLKQLCADMSGDVNQTRYADKYLTNLNLAQQQFAMDSKALFKDTSYTTASGTSTYDLPSDFLWEDTVTYNGFPLKPISRHTLYTLYPGTDWTLISGTPTHYMTDPETGVAKLRLIPIPDDAQAVSMRYYPFPTSVSVDSDVILNSSTLLAQFHMAVAALGAWLNLLGETSTPEILSKRTDLMKIYQDGVTKAVDTAKNTASEGLRLRPK